MFHTIVHKCVPFILRAPQSRFSNKQRSHEQVAQQKQTNKKLLYFILTLVGAVSPHITGHKSTNQHSFSNVVGQQTTHWQSISNNLLKSKLFPWLALISADSPRQHSPRSCSSATNTRLLCPFYPLNSRRSSAASSPWRRVGVTGCARGGRADGRTGGGVFRTGEDAPPPPARGKALLVPENDVIVVTRLQTPVFAVCLSRSNVISPSFMSVLCRARSTRARSTRARQWGFKLRGRLY